MHEIGGKVKEIGLLGLRWFNFGLKVDYRHIDIIEDTEFCTTEFNEVGSASSFAEDLWKVHYLDLELVLFVSDFGLV